MVAAPGSGPPPILTAFPPSCCALSRRSAPWGSFLRTASWESELRSACLRSACLRSACLRSACLCSFFRSCFVSCRSSWRRLRLILARFPASAGELIASDVSDAAARLATQGGTRQPDGHVRQDETEDD